ncbi:hypothetical protein E6C60_0756 [Paenibacillus algicola]|uniref:Uncharacterized protein n=1 Tax=Paenibacillus algicola TaxID=2565926 RepID=A0A4P8XG77_9BACL|nr:hypothetical protein E6C60_0756 [Paenibacillus algicola]
MYRFHLMITLPFRAFKINYYCICILRDNKGENDLILKSNILNKADI